MPTVRLVNPSRKRRRHSSRKARRRRGMPAGLKAYWAKKRSRNASRKSGGGHMAKHKRHHRRRAIAHRRRRTVRYRNRNPLMLFGAPKRRRHVRHHRRANRHHRRKNPDTIQSLTSGSMISMVGGGAIGFFGARMLPQNIPFLNNYNSGIPGYLLNAGSGLAISWLLKRFWNRQAGMGALVGTGVAVIARVITDNMGGATPSTTAGTSAAVAGLGSDLDFDLGYYINEFPFPQGASAGPYGQFVGTFRGGSPMVPTNASAVNAGAAAAAHALPAGTPASPAGGGNWSSNW